MSRYTVAWLQDAIEEPGDIWLAASDRNSVTEASEEIDEGLPNDAVVKGKPLSEGLRVYDAPPLRAVFSVIDSDRKVEVARIRCVVPHALPPRR